MSILIEGLKKVFGEKPQELRFRHRFNGREIFITDPVSHWNFFDNCKERMKEFGIEPLSIKEILKALPRRRAKQGVEKMVFFDTAIGFGLGNHFRILKIYPEFSMAEIQHCSRFGNIDSPGVPSFSVGLDEKLFRGVNIEYIRHEGRLLTLSEIQNLHEGRIDHWEASFITHRGIPGQLEKTPPILPSMPPRR